RCLGPRQRNRRCAVLWIVLSVSLLLLSNRLMTVKAGGRATPSFSVTAQSSRQSDGSLDAGKDPPAVGVFEPVDSTELLLPARRTAAQSIPTRQAPRGSASQTNAAQGDKDLRQLEPGKPIEQKFAGGQSHSYRVTITTGQYLHVVIDQQGIDVALTLFTPDGKQEMDVNLTGIGGLEALSYEASASGDYRITVRALGAATLSGSYQARLEMRASATAQDKQRIVAERLLAEATQLSRQGTAIAEQLLAKAQQALGEWQALGDQYWAAYALNLLGIASRSLNRHENAIGYFEQALKISKEMKDRASEGRSLNNLGNTYYSMRRYEKAVEYYEEALAIRQEVKDRASEGRALNNLGNAYRSMRRNERAIEYYEEALAIRREVKDRTGEGVTLGSLGNAYRSLSRNERAIEYYEQALAIKRDMKDRGGEGATLGSLGLAYQSLSWYEKAIEYYEQTLAIMREVKNRGGEGATLGNLGLAYDSLSRYEKAIEYR